MPSRSRSETTRRQLCLAAETLVAQSGVGVATLRAVASAAAQRNTAAVSYHFGSINELLRAVVDMRLRDSEEPRARMIAQCARSLDEMDAFTVWRCMMRPYFELTDEQVPHAHMRFLMHMSGAGLLTDPFDARMPRPGAPSIAALLRRLHDALSWLPPQIGRARVAMAGTMMWNAVALYDKHGFGDEQPALTFEALIDDIENLARSVFSTPA